MSNTFFAELKRRNVIRVGAAYVVVSWLIIQVVETIFPVFDIADDTIRMVIILLALGFIPALMFAWAFELTPQGLMKESEVDRSQSVTHHTGKKLDRTIIVLLVLGLAYFAYDKYVVAPEQLEALEAQKTAEVEAAKEDVRAQAQVETEIDKSIAVLAFQDMSPNKDQEYFSDGIAEELLNLLARIPELKVISRSSAFSYKGKDITLSKIGEQLNVAHILEGSVRKSGNQIRITAQLIEAKTDTHLWSHTYDRTLDNVFAIQDEIAATVVEELKLTLLGAPPKAQEVNPEAYALLLQGRQLSRLQSPEGYVQAIELLKQALAIEPNYPRALDMLATIYLNQAISFLRPWDEGYALAREATDKALAIDPDYAESYSRLGWISMGYDKDLAQAARHFQRALELEPNSLAIIGNSAALLGRLNRIDEAIEVNEYLASADPVNPIRHGNLAGSYAQAERWDEAIASIQTALVLSPDYSRAQFRLGLALLAKGNPESALVAFAKDEGVARRLLGESLAEYALGNIAESDKALNTLITEHEYAAYGIAVTMAYRNEADLAFEWLAKAAENDGPLLQGIHTNYNFKNIHDDPRWLPLLESVGKSPEQLQKLREIEFKVTLPKRGK